MNRLLYFIDINTLPGFKRREIFREQFHSIDFIPIYISNTIVNMQFVFYL